MRPIYLNLENFGAFPKAEVNFESLGDFFVVSGKTGAGKTTLFDAIAYALYGEASGTRKEEGLKSQFSGELAVPNVQFKFSLGNQIYRVNRTLAHKRKKKRGEGTLEVPQELIFEKKTQKGWQLFEGNRSDVQVQLQNLLKLSKEEFSKIVLLPQGEFQRFLEADSAERSNLLEKLFPTKVIQQLTDYFKKKAGVLVEKQRELTIRLRENQKKFKPDHYKEDFKNLDKNLKSCELELQTQTKEKSKLEAEQKSAIELKSQFEQKLKFENSLRELENKSEQIKKIKKQLLDHERALPICVPERQWKDLLQAQKETDNRLLSLTNERQKIDHQWNESQEHFNSIALLEKDLASLQKKEALFEKELPKYKRKFELEQQKTSLYARLIQEQKELDKLLETNQGLQNDIDKIKSISEDLLTNTTQLHELQTQLEKWNQNLALSKESEKKEKELKRLQNQVESLHDAIRLNQKQVQINQAERERLEQMRNQNFASVLSSQLEDGTPCPVCGSVEHPNKTTSHQNEFTLEETLEVAIQNLQDSESSLTQKKINLKGLEAKQSEIHKNAKESIYSVLDCISQIAKLQNEFSSKEKRKKEIESELQEKKKLETFLVKSTNDLEFKNVSLQKVKEEYTKIDIRCKELGAGLENIENPELHLEQLQKECKQKNEEILALNQEKSDLQKKLALTKSSEKDAKRFSEELKLKTSNAENELNRSIQKAHFLNYENWKQSILSDLEKEELQKTIEQYQRSKTEKESALKQLMLILKNRELPKEDYHVEALKDLSQKIEKQQAERDYLKNEISKLESNQLEYSQILNELNILENDSGHSAELADLLQGKNSKRLSFQNYVLGTYLQEVIERANLRLRILSGTRYHFQLNDESQNRKSQFGLELDVFDSHTGDVRSVRTLSGGEKFMASISLALGLSDRIQERAGGIHLESVFIDEGFGSLDSESLDRAIGVLEGLQSGRMIGIISHVSELKSRIPSCIEVIKERNGSKLREQVF